MEVCETGGTVLQRGWGGRQSQGRQEAVFVVCCLLFMGAVRMSV
jgi:hypothetical protein